MKQSGILLHISSLATDFGIGDLGPAAEEFCRYLKREGHSYWQILPLNHCGYGNSPYNPISAFAFNQYLISLELLCDDGYLSPAELATAHLPRNEFVDYEAVIKVKGALLELAAQRMLLTTDILPYIQENAWHLKPYLAFCVLSKLQENPQWYTWPLALRHYSSELFDELYQEHQLEMKRIAILQMVFEAQFSRLKSTMNASGISLIGDIPLYLSYESAEVWAHQELFDLDDTGQRLSMAGVPPDAFAVNGQLWGNPIYRWDRLKAQNFELFIRRFAHLLQYLDLLRLDHFIGYVNFWKISSQGSQFPETAVHGHWERAEPEAFFERVLSYFPKETFIAEDLGMLNADVCQVRDSLGFPGMIILQFCFEESVPEVQDYPADRFIYTGTHDNCTTRGWWNALPQNSPSRLNLALFCKRFLPDYGLPNEDNIHLVLGEIARISGCQRRIIPMQDILGLDDAARMNIPGIALGNWHWRMQAIAIELP